MMCTMKMEKKMKRKKRTAAEVKGREDAKHRALPYTLSRDLIVTFPLIPIVALTLCNK